MAKSYDVVIVGAGHNGLACAAYLARAGRSVLVLERREVVGGRAVTEEFAPGFRASATFASAETFDPDPHHGAGARGSWFAVARAWRHSGATARR